MDAENSSEWLPPGFAEKTEVKNGRNIKYYYNVTTGVKYHSKKDVIHCATEDFFRDAPRKTICDDNVESSDNKIDVISVKTNNFPKWLPDGWRMEEKIRKNGSSAGSTYKIYIDSSRGIKFYSKLAVARYLKTIGQNDATTEQSKLDNVGEPSLKPDTSLQCKSLSEVDCFRAKNLQRKKSFTVVASDSTSADWLPKSEAGSIPGKKLKRKKSFTVVETETTSDHVVPPSVAGSTPGKKSRRKKSFTVVDSETTLADLGPPSIADSTRGKSLKRKKSFTVVDTETTSADVVPPSLAGSTPGKNSKRKKSFTVVAVESTPADGLPPGWVKEIKTSKSRNKIRKDPYYIEPVNGYMFLSKKDALRYLETNDIGSCACIPKRKDFENLKLKKNEVTPDNVGEPFLKPDTSFQSKSMIDTDCSPQKRESKHSSAMVAAESTSVEGLPSGWIKEIMTRKSGNKIRKDAYYTDPVTGYMFRSKNDALRYLKTNDIRSCAVKPKKRELGDLTLIKNKIPFDNSGESSLKPEASKKCESMIDGACITEIKRNSQHPSSAVATEIASAYGLPPGWIKEIKTSQSGDKIRKDPFYTDPVSGYIFRSKKDVLRYLETNDISSCAIRPKRREIDGPKSIKKKTPSSSPINKKLSKQLETKTKLFVGGESNADGGGGCSTKTQAASKANTLKVVSAGADRLKVQYSCENSNKLFDMKIDSAQTNECSEQGANAMTDVLAVCSFINDVFTEEKLPESKMEKPTDGTQSEPRISKKRLRASKRLEKSEPEMLSNVDLSERTLMAATKRSSAISGPLPSDLDPSKKVADHAFAVKETLQEEDPLNKVERPLAEDNTTLNEELSNKVENGLAEHSAILKEQTEGKTSGKQLNDDSTSQDMQPCYEFGDTWTDPCLEFAYKTLTGEIPLDDTLPFPEIPDIPYNQENGGMRTLASEEPTMFESEIPPGFESTNQNYTVEKVPGNPSFHLSAVDALFESEIPPGFESPANPLFSTEQVFSDKSS